MLLLPGTGLVVEPAVMVEPNYWRFEASVWQAAQELQPGQCQQHGRRDIEHAGEGRPGSDDSVTTSGDSVTPSGDDVRESVVRFQDTDLPHPGWEEIVSNS